MSYRSLFGLEAPTDASVTDWAEHGRVGGVSTGQPFKYVSAIDGTTPVEGNNPSLVLGYTGDNLTTITKTIGAVSYRKTLSYTGAVLDSVSAWVQL